MARLEELKRGAVVKGILPYGFVTVVDVNWIGSVAIELTYKDSWGKLGNELIYRDREIDLEILESGKPWSFDGEPDLFRLASEAHRIRLAYLFDPLLAVHTSLVDPLPHQITAVYEDMLPRQPLRFLLADDPGAGKTIMTGLLIKELIARGDLQRCLNEEVEATEERVVDLASAARTIAELKAEIAILQELETLALRVRQSNSDRKWDELSRLLQNQAEMFDAHGHRRKLIIFTEHRDTLNYLQERIGSLVGRPEAVVTIHGGMGREDRRKAEQLFTQDKDTEVLIATDAAGEGINLQRAHLMVNYDLPWNPNRLEQRFGRIHRIGQTEVCHCWNLVASETREGDVYRRLLEKLDEERKALGGKVFDILGKLTFNDKPLRQLLIEAVRYGDRPEVRARLNEVVDNALDRNKLRELIEEHALAHDSMDATRVQAIREEMERAEARRLQPHFIASFFLEAFKRLGGAVREREPKRYEITHVPAVVRNRDRAIGMRDPVLTRYERITFEKSLISMPGKPMAEFVCPGHPLLDATLDLILERHRDLLKQGAIMIDENDPGDQIRALVYLEHSIQDARTDRSGNRRIVSRQVQFVEVTKDGEVFAAGYAPYLDYRPSTAAERKMIEQMPDSGWLQRDIESLAMDYAVQHLVPRHLQEVKSRKEELVDKTIAAVKERLTVEINYWDHRAEQLKQQELAGRINARINSAKARQRADELASRLQRRMEELQQERQVSPLPPNVIGGAMIVPIGLLRLSACDAQAGGDRPTPCYIRQPFAREPDFGVTSVNYKLEDLLTKGRPPQ